MKFKYYLRGVGVGVLVTTIILVIAFSVTGNNISDKEVIKRAKKLGMVMVDSDDSNKTVKEEQQEKKDSDKTNTDKKQNTDKTEAESETTDTIQIEVSAGDNPRVVINKLLDAGLIDDYDTFSNYLHSNGLDNIVYPGSYSFNKDMSMEDIAKLLTTKE